LIPAAVIAAVIAVAAAGVFFLRGRNALPAPGSETYERVTRAFYRGLASLEVGLVDDAKREFTTVTTTVAAEPAAWANLGLAHLRLGELDAAAAPIDRAVMLAPDNAELVLLAGRMEITRGRLDEGLAHLRRAVELAPDALRPRFALAEELENANAPNADPQALALLDALLKRASTNMAVLVERARVAAKAHDLERLNDSIAKLKPLAGRSQPAMEQYRNLLRAVEANDFATAQRDAQVLRYVLAPLPAFGEDHAAVSTSTALISEAIEHFIALTPPPAIPAAPDLTLTLGIEPILPALRSVAYSVVTIPADGKEAPQILAVEFDAVTAVTGPAMRLAFPSRSGNDFAPGADSVAIVDWNNDFRRDIVMAGAGGVRLFVQQADRQFLDRTPAEKTASECICRAVWPADVEMDGDMDIIAAPQGDAPPFVLRNNGDGSWTVAPIFVGAPMNVTQFAWADLDDDGDPDAAFLGMGEDGEARVYVFANRQAGDFALLPVLPASPFAFTVADIDSDGSFDIITLERSGTLRSFTLRAGQWVGQDIASWPIAAQMITSARLIAEDLDNNGALDLIATGEETSRIWLGTPSHQLLLLDAPTAGKVFPAGDLNSDGRLDFIAIAPVQAFSDPYRVVRLVNRGSRNYRWKKISPRAQETAGDQRINSFGVGGYVEARAGLLFQKQLLTGGPVHLGLGMQSTIDVARIVWPNGIPQAEFGTPVNDTMVAEQRLKGSCPWVFAWDGTRMTFVTDFLWRSPLGLRINAQDTAGVTQTEDWVRLRGEQLVPRNGFYDVRITAELWETHFFDHVSLLAVDHPADAEILVDERFSPASPPALAVQAMKNLRPVPRAWDQRGVDVTATIAARDGHYLSTFARGRYQGIASDHFVEIEPGAIGADSMLVAQGWIYPTDSSINVAIAQAGIAPRGLSLEAQNPDGSWRVVNGDLGFPAGKNKTVLIGLGGAIGAQRIRLRTNLEIYWDALQVGSRVDSPMKTTRIPAATAQLRYRGFSHTVSPRGDAPETPEYDRVVSTSQRWRDLTGYHTRFGDVRELIDRVDDRYVIMNAGDEMRLQFAEAAPPAAGWRRDYVLIGDGWEKDGDYNTGFSQTVLPLPSHAQPAYGAATRNLALEDDPVYQRHRDDWQRYHTRYVTPRAFVNGLKPAKKN
jgi:tetratricopeptide (TPR) repeat protein